jgi:hypothetical protein
MAKMSLEELVRQLGLVYGDGLRCVVLYGSAARGEHIAKRSDLNVLVLVDEITMDHLRREGAAARAWRESGNPPPLTLTLREWRGSADIFPIEYADILAHHRVLQGTLPVDGVQVDRDHMRLQLEHEAMSKLLRLRHSVLSTAGDTKGLIELMRASVSSVMVLLRATLRLLGDEPPADSLDVLGRVQARTGIQADVFRQILHDARGESRIAPEAVNELVSGYLAGVGELVGYLDRYRSAER